MLTWDNLLIGYDTSLAGYALSTNTMSEAFTSGAVSTYYLQAIAIIFPVVKFVLAALLSSGLIIALFFGFWYLIIVPALRFLGIR